MLRGWYRLVWLLILVPLSVDNRLSLPVGDYDLRLQYLGTFLALGTLLAEGLLQKQDLKAMAKAYFSSRFVWAFLALLAVGAAGALLVSTHPVRSLLFVGWTGMSLLLAPAIVLWLSFRLEDEIPLTLLAYALIQCGIVLFDAVVCIPTGGEFHLGRVMIYPGPTGALCRPHAWYQEPGYFCGFMLLVTILALWHSRSAVSDRSRRIFAALALVFGLAVVATTSRMGWLGIGFLGLAILGKRIREIRRVQSRSVPLWALVLPTLVLGGVAFHSRTQLYNHVVRGLVKPWQDSSFRYRFMRLGAAVRVFRKSPLIGVGPGSAGAYLVDRIPEDRFLATLSGEEKAYLRHDPLAQNLPAELLSEWGLLGSLFFGIGLFFMFQGAPRPERLLLFGTLAIIYTATQTLARFDLWLMLSLLWARTQSGDPRSKPEATVRSLSPV